MNRFFTPQAPPDRLNTQDDIVEDGKAFYQLKILMHHPASVSRSMAMQKAAGKL